VNLEQLASSFDSSRAVLVNVDSDQMANATPCQLWNVADLINHMVSAPRYGASALATGSGVVDEQDYTSGDYVGAYDESKARTLAAFGAPGALEKMVAMPFGELPAQVLLDIIGGDQFLHGWDLARATGQPTPLDPTAAIERLEFARQVLTPDLRGPEGERPFGPVRTAPDGAGPADQLAAFLGREV
jgi:uncharacterized protein (TIGR03086 family)